LLKVVLSVKLLGSWETEISAKHDVLIIIHSVTPYGSSFGVKGLFELNAANTTRFYRACRSSDIIKIEMMSEEEERVTGSMIIRPWMTASTIIRADCYFEEAVVSPQGTEWTILTPNEEALCSLIHDLEKIGSEVRLVSKHKLNLDSF